MDPGEPRGGKPPRKQANFAIADLYDSGERYDLLDLIDRLVASDDNWDRERAFYIIRHTESTRRKTGVVLDDVFEEPLRRLFLDPGVERTVNRYMDTFRLNLSDFEELEETRRRRFGSRRKRERRGQRPRGR